MELSGRPLFDNPLDASLFVPRRGAARIERNCRDGVNTLLLGPAGSGRTSLLRNVLLQLREEEFPAVLVDAAPADGVLDFLRLVSASLGRIRPITRRVSVFTAVGLGEVGSVLDELRNLRPADEEGDVRTAILVDLALGSKPHELFGRFRDELWQLPYTWIVAAPEQMRSGLLTPPADAFFDEIIEMEPLNRAQQEELVRRRMGPGEQTPWRLPSDGEGNPRRLLEIIRESVRSGLTPDQQMEAVARRERDVAALGRPASMLYAELQNYGPASASDEELLDRLGWSRQRAAQVLAQLEEGGFVYAQSLHGPSGRPPKVFAIDPPGGK